MRPLMQLLSVALLSFLSGCIIYPKIDSENPPRYPVLDVDPSSPDAHLYFDNYSSAVYWRGKTIALDNARLATDYWVRSAENSTNLSIDRYNAPPLDSEYWNQRSLQQPSKERYPKANWAKLEDGSDRERCQWQLISDPRITKQQLGANYSWCSNVSPAERELAYDKALSWREEWLHTPSGVDVCVASLRSSSRAEVSRGPSQQSPLSACRALSQNEWYSAVRRVEPMLSRWDKEQYPLVSAP